MAKRIKQGPPGRVRIIAGNWRGRQLPVPDIPGLRPTGDRARETLFNWLQPWIPGARCLDLFAGTGVLGLEAASRGAEHVTLLEQSPQAVRALEGHCDMLGAQQVRVEYADAFSWMQRRHESHYDIVFIDPPFADEAGQRAFDALVESVPLSDSARIYLETGRSQPAVSPARGWTTWREKVMGEVRLQVIARTASAI